MLCLHVVVVYPIISQHLFSFREWMGKVDRMRSRTSDNQEGWKEGSEERGGSKASWADSVDPRAPSPGSVGQYSKSAAPQDYQVNCFSV